MRYGAFWKIISLLCVRSALLASAANVHDIGGKQTRIIGGDRAETQSYPFFVRLEKENRTASGIFHCGGTLLSPEYVLTAAHCDAPTLTAYVGPENMENPIRVVKHFKHPGYDPSVQKYDIMLLQLAYPVRDVTPVTLSTDAALPQEGEELIVIGKGTVSVDQYIPSETLLQTTVTAWSQEACATRYDSLVEIEGDLMLCAGGDGQDSCMGDSGSAILNKDFLQIGVVSFGVSCANPEWPGVYARVTAVADWSDKVICENAVFDRSNPRCRDFRGRPGSLLVSPELSRTIQARDFDIPIDPLGETISSTEGCNGSNCNLRRRCRDDESARLFINSISSMRDCRWLSRHTIDKLRLCSPGSGARDVCKHTCGAC